MLSRFARPPAPPGERCELCAQDIAEPHPHVVDLVTRTLACACAACGTLFRHFGAGARYRTVPDRVLVDPAFSLDDQAWAALRIPVGLAFVFCNSSLSRWVAFYPSPAGSTEAELPEQPWQALLASSPLLAEVQPDVEALLVHRPPGAPGAYFLVPIDACYRLVAKVRLTWRGFHGGDAARAEIEDFFAELRTRARPLRPSTADEVRT
jgi:hypothetical protein